MNLTSTEVAYAYFSLFLNLELFWMNNKAIIEFAFVGYKKFCRSRRVLSNEAEGLDG